MRFLFAPGLFLFLSGCSCVTQTEHRLFVESSRAFFDSVAPIVSEVAQRDAATGRITQQSCENRLGLLRDRDRAIRDAEARVR